MSVKINYNSPSKLNSKIVFLHSIFFSSLQLSLLTMIDIYISCVSDTHEVAPKGHYIVLVSTFVETSNPKAELQPGLALLGNVLHQFWSVDPLYAPINDYKTEGIHISHSYDATSHFETIANDVIRIYREVTGEQNVDYLFVPKEKPAEK